MFYLIRFQRRGHGTIFLIQNCQLKSEYWSLGLVIWKDIEWKGKKIVVRPRERFSDQKGLCISHPLSLLKSELIMPLNILNERVTDIVIWKEVAPGFPLSQTKGKRQRGRLGRIPCIYFWIINHWRPRYIHGQRKWMKIHPRGNVNNKYARKLSSDFSSPHSGGCEMVKLQP